MKSGRADEGDGIKWASLEAAEGKVGAGRD